MIVAGQAKDLLGAVHAASDGSQVYTGTIYCAVRLESSDADDGKFWDANDDTWQTSPVAWPTAAHTQGGQWSFALPAIATNGKASCYIHYTFTDDLDESVATTISGGGEHYISAGTPASEPAGVRQVTIHVKDGVGAPVPQAGIAIFDPTNTVFLTQGTADSGGDLVVALDDGTYKLRMHKSLYSFTVPETLTVSGDGTHNYTATAFSAPAPSSPELCVVYGTILDASGVAVADETVSVSVETPTTSDSNQLSLKQVSTTTNSSGYFEIELVRGARVNFTCVTASLRDTYLVPEAANQDLTTWLPE